MVNVSQNIIYQIRDDLFKHLQKLPFQYYDDRPQGKILVRVVNYVNSVSDMLSNGLINVILEIINLVFIGKIAVRRFCDKQFVSKVLGNFLLFYKESFINLGI